MSSPLFPSLYQINTRVWLYELGQKLGRAATLADVTDAMLDEIAAGGFDWVWLLGVWQTGEESRKISASQADWRAEFQRQLPDFQQADVCGSPFAVQAYDVHLDFGGYAALVQFRQRLKERGIQLLLDFVPNHTALDHDWVARHPEYYVAGTPDDLGREPHNYIRFPRGGNPLILAHGRDPYFPGWPDTLQLNYRHLGARLALARELQIISMLCDGVRCDMAMLVLPEVFQKTWGEKSLPADGTRPEDGSFWRQVITSVHRLRPGFVFMAEVYWDMEWTLQQEGFDYTYDKRLYDRLHQGDAAGVRGHLQADPQFQRKSIRFLENHDEPRAAATFSPEMHAAAATLTYLAPGLRFFHDGQLTGRTQRANIHLRRRAVEQPNPQLTEFYRQLLGVLRLPQLRGGSWQLLTCDSAWDGNPTWQNFIAFWWDAANGEGDAGGRHPLLVVVNYGPNPGQCRVRWPRSEAPGRNLFLGELMRPQIFERQGSDLMQAGLFVDLPAWGCHLLEVRG